MIQGGQVNASVASIPDEIGSNNNNVKGTIAMANGGPNTATSQFFINVVDNYKLNPKHPAFGKVVAGMDVVDRIATVPKDRDDRPRKAVPITKARIVS